jgi:hypothetical protein
MSPNQSNSIYASYSAHQPSVSTLANDRFVSRSKLQSTWEDIIQKYSTLSEAEADEIDLDTGEVVVDHGHLKSLHTSALWEPIDSEQDDYDELDTLPSSDQGEPNEAEIMEYGLPENVVQPDDPILPSEEEIIKQFGEEYGRDIMQYLKDRNSALNVKSRRSQLWKGPEDEERIFTRAKELWRRYRMMRPSPVKSALFDKESFERAVFGAKMTARTAFEKAVFGQQSSQGEDSYDEEDDYSDYDEETDDNNVLPDYDFEFLDEDEERRINDLGRPVTYAVDPIELSSPPSQSKRQQIKKAESPEKQRSTPSLNTVSRSPLRLSAKAKERLRGNVVSGLIVDATDDEADILPFTPSVKKRIQMNSPRETPKSPLHLAGKSRKSSTPNTLKEKTQIIRARDSDIIVDEDVDTKRTCGDLGYRCTKTFCFKCVS